MNNTTEFGHFANNGGFHLQLSVFPFVYQISVNPEYDTLVCWGHGLRTPNEGINQRYLKNWADVADKICCRHT